MSARGIHNKATRRQLDLKILHGLSDRQFDQMLMMLEQLTADERRLLSEPDFITEDEADTIVCARREKNDHSAPVALSDALKDLDLRPRHRRSA